MRQERNGYVYFEAGSPSVSVIGEESQICFREKIDKASEAECVK